MKMTENQILKSLKNFLEIRLSELMHETMIVDLATHMFLENTANIYLLYVDVYHGDSSKHYALNIYNWGKDDIMKMPPKVIIDSTQHIANHQFLTLDLMNECTSNVHWKNYAEAWFNKFTKHIKEELIITTWYPKDWI